MGCKNPQPFTHVGFLCISSQDTKEVVRKVRPKFLIKMKQASPEVTLDQLMLCGRARIYFYRKTNKFQFCLWDSMKPMTYGTYEKAGNGSGMEC